MNPNGNKEALIRVDNTKMFVDPYYSFMINHFFGENLPDYPQDSFDKPNEYDADPENWPSITLKVLVDKSLACLADDKNKTLACTLKAEYDYKREKIRDAKEYLAKKLKQ